MAITSSHYSNDQQQNPPAASIQAQSSLHGQQHSTQLDEQHQQLQLQAIASLISNEQHNVQQLTALLKQEGTLLEARDGETLQSIIAQKQQLITLLAQNGISRQQILQQNQRELSPESWRNLLQQLDLQFHHGFSDQWKAVEDQLRECKKQNEANGKIIKRTQVSVGQLLDIMRGKAGQTKLYNQKGYAGDGGGYGRVIASA